ncbi:4-Cys prefix domain-containing protein [Faecalispora anaeroviscerum]
MSHQRTNPAGQHFCQSCGMLISRYSRFFIS